MPWGPFSSPHYCICPFVSNKILALISIGVFLCLISASGAGLRKSSLLSLWGSDIFSWAALLSSPPPYGNLPCAEIQHLSFDYHQSLSPSFSACV